MKKLLITICFAGAFVSCNNMNNNMAGSTSASDKESKNEAGVQKFYDLVINAHNPAMLDSFCQPDFVNHNPGPGHSGKGIEDTKAEFKDLFTMFPDAHMKANFIIAKGDTVVSHLTLTGTNSGSSPNMPATNKSVNYDGVDIIVIKDGKATERWGYFDGMKMMQQLGMAPEHEMKSETEKAVEEKMKDGAKTDSKKMTSKKK